jgi:hypothetical protein
VSGPTDKEAALDRLARFARPVILEARRAPGAVVIVGISRQGLPEAEMETRWPGARSNAERVLRALAQALDALLPTRPSAVLLEAEDEQVTRMLAGTYRARATFVAWEALQRTIGRASALGVRVYRKDAEGFVEFGAATLLH